MSTESLVVRPLWRTFKPRFLANAVAHVRAGGHAVLWKPTKKRDGTPGKPAAWMLLPCGPDGEMPELSYWAILALEHKNSPVVPRGLARGLATLRARRAHEWVLAAWCERDSVYPGATRAITVDCVRCAACCKNNRVVLYDEDFARWREGGRDDLRGKAYTRTDAGVVLLRLRRDGACVHLDDTRCGIYTLRPDNCSMFPAGSEPCLTSRDEELGLGDSDADRSAPPA